MDDHLTSRPPPNRAIAVAVLALLALVIGLFGWNLHQKRQQAEELAVAQGLVKVLSVTFAKQSSLKVGSLDGALDVTSIDPGRFDFLRSAQKVKLPYSVEYSVDLTRMTPANYRWDARHRTLLVEAPDVIVGRPNIDESHRTLIATQGIFVTRRAAENLSRRAAVQANRAAVVEASKPVHLDRARANARQAIAAMLATPLEVAGLGKVEVVVRLPQDRISESERWDVSRSIAEVLAEQEARR